jgi:hypothetical protein
VNGLDAASRDALERAILKGRRILEQDLAEAAEGRFGIYANGVIDPEDALRLSPGELSERRETVEVVIHLRREGETAEGAVRRLVREAAFTHLNRLVAIRVAEAIGLLPESLAQGRASQGFRDALEVAPLLAADATGGYWTYLRLCGDELAADDSVLFDPRNPLLDLAPSPAALDGLVEILADPKLAAAWVAPDTLGWTYQFFNTGEERRRMRDESPAPRTSRELAVRNQFFTPRYVVDFLVQNSLGRRLAEADPDSGLVDELPLLVDPPSTRGQPLSLDEVRVLDPACGSGHFLLGCYDLLELAWQRAGVKPPEAAARILPCLWGIDIDPRCAQVASAVLMLRARRACREGDLPRPNVLTARALPEDPDAWERALAGLSSTHRKLVGGLRDALTQAPVLGPLLKVEERLSDEVYRAVPEAGGEDTLFGATGMAAAATGRAEAEVLAAVQRVADEASSTAAERLLAAEATDAIRFVEAMRQRYDIVLMNPPFGEPISETKPYLLASYVPVPSNHYNILCPFVERGVELLSKHGYLGAITSRAPFFLSSVNRWREEVVLEGQIIAFADLGFGVMQGAMVEAAAYVLGAQASTRRKAAFIRVLKEADKAEGLSRSIAGHDPDNTFSLSASELRSIPGSAFAYWMPVTIRRLFAEVATIGDQGDVSVHFGLSTKNDFQFIRAFWEIPIDRIGRSRDDTKQGKPWVPLAKGGEYSPYYADIHLLVNWKDDGATIERWVLDKYPYLKGKAEWVLHRSSSYFQWGIAWPRRTTSGFGPRALPEGCMFSDKSTCAFLSGDAAALLLGILNTRLLRAIADGLLAAGEETVSGTAAKSYEVGLVRRLPWLLDSLTEDARELIVDLVQDLVSLRAEQDRQDETARAFVVPSLIEVRAGPIRDRVKRVWDARETRIVFGLKLVDEIESLVNRAAGLDSSAADFLNTEYGPRAMSHPLLPLEDEQEFARLYQEPIDTIIDEAIKALGGARVIATKSYFLDRRVEVLAYMFERHPGVLGETRKRLGLLPREEPRKSVEEFVSYLIGVAFGRWDLRIGVNSSLALPKRALSDPVPLCPPGMLVGEDGFPAWTAPPGYPLQLPPDRLLVDEPGHEWDIGTAVRRAAAVLLDDPDPILAEVEGILGHRSVRDYLRKQFFKDHLGRYSKSRRKAPIYWYLSVPSRGWGVWVYAPALSRETLYAVASHAARRHAAGKERIAALRAERDTGGRGRSPREVGQHLEAEEELVKELEAFRAEAEQVASLGWEPDLDDGIILCAAPLADLFPAWRAAAEERAKLRKGAYPWASVSRWREAL